MSSSRWDAPSRLKQNQQMALLNYPRRGSFINSAALSVCEWQRSRDTGWDWDQNWETRFGVYIASMLSTLTCEKKWSFSNFSYFLSKHSCLKEYKSAITWLITWLINQIIWNIKYQKRKKEKLNQKLKVKIKIWYKKKKMQKWMVKNKW